jgi:predicted CXXCH cytochrome family protein
MRHLIRAAGLLALFVVSIFAVKSEFIPRSFGQYGHYRGENVKEWANLPVVYSTVSNCQACHQEKYEVWARSRHSTVTCENCHGPAKSHIARNTKLTMERSKKLCALCHSRLVSRPVSFPQVDLEKHSNQLACITCHNPHNPIEKSSPVVSHPLEGRSRCLFCHGPTGLKPAPDNHAGRANETCLGCHRG